jgi:hypothetical protein
MVILSEIKRYKYSRVSVFTDSVSAVYRGPKKMKMKDINGSSISKSAPSENGP